MANINPAAGGLPSHYAHGGVTPPQVQTNPPPPRNGQTTHTGSTTGTPPGGQTAQGPQGPQGPSQKSHRGQTINTTA